MSDTHIIVHKPGADQVLSRKAGYLAKLNKWTISDRPRPGAETNLFFPYILLSERFPEFGGTQLAAYFTHDDVDNEIKNHWWRFAAGRVDIRFTTSYVSELAGYGETIHARPPVDPQFFGLMVNFVKSDDYIVGVSGMSYKDGRKGESLLEKLAGLQEKHGIRLVGAGRGWPFTHRWYPWDDMASFYDQLHIYLCTSLIEGVPMPPLEALARGIPVIVPRNVGMMDELPNISGIWRFKAGSSISLGYALKRARAEWKGVDRDALVDSVSDYTVTNWASDFAQRLNTSTVRLKSQLVTLASEETAHAEFVPPMHDGKWRKKAGMYCVAFGKPAVTCVKTLISSFRKFMPGIPIMLVSNKKVAGVDHMVICDEKDIGARVHKLSAYEITPPEWEYVLYMDADTEVMEDISSLYKILVDGWEALICKDMAKYHTARMMIRPDNKEEFEHTMETIGCADVFQYNGGIFAFRRTNGVRDLFKCWQKEWDMYAGRDQGALLRALYRHPIKLFLLTNHWNASDRYPTPVGGAMIMHHSMKARRWGGLIYGRTDSEEAWEKVKDFR